MTGDELRAWRKRMGHKAQQGGADELGATLRTYQRWENAKTVPRVVQLAAEALELQRQWADLRGPLSAFAAKAVSLGH